MKFSCNSSELQKLVAIVEKAVPSRTTVPVLENVLMELSSGWLKMRGNDMELGIEDAIQIQSSEQDGAVLIKAKTLSNILSKLQNVALSVEVKPNFTIQLKGEHVDFDVLGLSAQEYPEFPQVAFGTKLQLQVGDLKELIRHTLFSVSTDDTKPFLNGILAKMEGESLTFVATDGYRLALKTTEMKGVQATFSVIIPNKTITELQKICQYLSDDSQIDVTISEKQVVFKHAQLNMISRLIEGKFPDYRQVIPKATSQSFLVSRRAFLDACERASIFSSFSNHVMKITVMEEKILIRAVAASMGEFCEELMLQRVSGHGETRISFNVKLVLDALRNMDSDDVKLSFNDALSPCLFESSTQDSGYLYVVMPIRTNDSHEERPAAAAVQPAETAVSAS